MSYFGCKQEPPCWSEEYSNRVALVFYFHLCSKANSPHLIQKSSKSGFKKIKEICTNPLVLTSNIGIIPKALGKNAKNKVKEAMKMANAQSLFEILKTTIYLSDFSTVVINGKTCEWNKDELRDNIEAQATEFLCNQDYHKWEIDDIKFSESATGYLEEFFPETLKEIELDAAEWYAFDILEKLGFEKKDLQSIGFQL